MDIEIQGHNLRVSDALTDYVQKKLGKLDRYLPNISEVRVELGREHTRRGEDLAVAQITIRHSRGAILRAQETLAGDIETALNQAVDKMYRQIQRFKGKRVRKGRERFSATVEELNVAEAIPEIEVDGDVPEEVAAESEIIRRKNVAVIAMNEEEAIEQMELLGHTFFIFFNQATGGINVIYKRRAGGYGVLNPVVE
ncbi:MAG: ribosome-associated translation inhibitor RaiA [Anaerolineae bacterium]|nr:ribosome-associated translation inhibitor RaiA [Anaerolineae bacterium]